MCNYVYCAAAAASPATIAATDMQLRHLQQFMSMGNVNYAPLHLEKLQIKYKNGL